MPQPHERHSWHGRLNVENAKLVAERFTAMFKDKFFSYVRADDYSVEVSTSQRIEESKTADVTNFDLVLNRGAGLLFIQITDPVPARFHFDGTAKLTIEFHPRIGKTIVVFAVEDHT